MVTKNEPRVITSSKPILVQSGRHRHNFSGMLTEINLATGLHRHAILDDDILTDWADSGPEHVHNFRLSDFEDDAEF